tara:strand:+ start:33 stop:755 length:723 start_codon:yes stop_codon:yes gene_type:complete
VCEPSAILGVASAVAQQGAAEQAVSAKNRAKLKNHERNNQNYLTQVMLDNARWKNDVQIADMRYDQIYQNLVDQWIEKDKQLDKLFAKHDRFVEKAIQTMYENEYAGTLTGITAARLAGKSAKKMGYEKAKSLNELMFSKEETELKKDRVRTEADHKQWDIFDKIRFTPIHGHAPWPPLMLAAPSRAGMFASIAGSVFGAMGGGAPSPGSGLMSPDYVVKPIPTLPSGMTDWSKATVIGP